MKILFLSFPYIPFGGQGRIVRDLAFGLVAKGHELSLLCLDASGKVPLDFPGEKRELSEGFARYRAKWRKAKELGGFAIASSAIILAPLFFVVGWKFVFFLFRLARNKDVLVWHGQYESAWIAFVQMCLPGKRKTIGVIHASIAGYLSAVERFFLFPYFRRLDSIVVLSRAEKAYFVEYGVPQERIRVIPNGIDADSIPLLASAPMEPRIADFMSGDPYIVCVARLCPQKDQANLLYAFEKYSKKYPTVKLLFVGAGELAEELKELSEDLKISDKTYFAWPMENPFSYMANALFHVLASRYEGFGLVHAEALLLGCPVIASDVPTGPREILSGLPCPSDRFVETPYWVLVPKEASDVLAEAMEFVTANITKFEQKAHFGSLYVKEKYSLKNMVEEYEGVIHST